MPPTREAVAFAASRTRPPRQRTDQVSVKDEGHAAPSHIWRDIYFTVHDGLRLYARDYGDRKSTALPVVCLAGLTRNSKDFHDIAVPLSRNRRVLALDYRGRGLSEHASDWTSYNPIVELADTLALMAREGVEEAAVIGTSRGGLIAMLMAAVRPTALKAVVLNDIGPEISTEGLLRIRGYLQYAPSPAHWDDARDILQKSNPGFHNLSEAEWTAFARRTFRDARGVPKIDFDPNLGRTFVSYDDIVYGRVPTLWSQFAAMNAIPALVVRGENSDLLSVGTVEKMRRLRRNLDVITVPGRGHAPFLTEDGILDAIEKLIAKADTHR